MMTTFSLPIFSAPLKPIAQGAIEGLQWESDGWWFQVKNTGNVHMQLQTVSVTGFGASTAPVLQRRLPGRYILAGTTGMFQLDYTPDECARLKNVLVVVATPNVSARQSFDAPPNSCPK
jgi:P pilus assembly chaperone PapD